VTSTAVSTRSLRAASAPYWRPVPLWSAHDASRRPRSRLQRRPSGVRRGTDEPPGIGRVARRSSTRCAARSATGRWASTPSTIRPAMTSWPPPSRQRRECLHPGCGEHLPGHQTRARRLLPGAAIIDVITSGSFPAIGFNNPLPPNVPDHVAALAVSGTRPPRSACPDLQPGLRRQGHRPVQRGRPDLFGRQQRASAPQLRAGRNSQPGRGIRRQAA